MTEAANATTNDIVRFTTRQVEKLAEATGVTADDVRRAQRTMPVRNDFMLSLGYVHMSRHPQVNRIENARRRHLEATQAALDLKSVWQGDATVESMMAIGRRQAETGKVVQDEPSKFMSWLDRVWSKQASASPSPAMAR
ncbi:hypothetical protein ACVIGB_000913 [Bradyrhizobium sp. USDA 4341]